MTHNILNAEDKEFIREYVASGASAEDQIRLRRECAESFQVSLQTIAAITAWTKIRTNKAAATFPAADTVADNIEETGKQNDDSQAREEARYEGGEHYDYDNETKKAWRKKLQEFVAEHTDPQRRAKMRVLCLPGKKCLEIQTYLDLGFKPCNIVAVEGGDQRAKDEFRENATRMGVQYHIGRLEAVLPEEKKPFDVVSLDFLGPMCHGYEEILRMLPLADEAIVLLNTLAKRENRVTKLEYNMLDSFCYRSPAEVLHVLGIEVDELAEILRSGTMELRKRHDFQKYADRLKEKFQNGIPITHDLRKRGLTMKTLTVLQMPREGKTQERVKKLREMIAAKLRGSLLDTFKPVDRTNMGNSLLAMMMMEMAVHLDESEREVFKKAGVKEKGTNWHAVLHPCFVVAGDRPLFTGYKGFEYSSGSRSPMKFLSEFVACRSTKTVERNCPAIIDFILTALERTIPQLPVFEAEGGISIADAPSYVNRAFKGEMKLPDERSMFASMQKSRGNIHKAEKWLEENTAYCLYDQNGRLLSKITARQLRKELEWYHDYLKNSGVSLTPQMIDRDREILSRENPGDTPMPLNASVAFSAPHFAEESTGVDPVLPRFFTNEFRR